MEFNGKAIYIETYGCQQNEADSERIVGIAEKMGFSQVFTPEEADLIIVNTCAVREHAELKALSNTGRLKHLKERNHTLRIGVCGCMVQQEKRKEDIKNKYPYVDFVFGTNMFEKLEGIIKRTYSQKKRILNIEGYDVNPGTVCEGLPQKRRFSYKAYVSIMSGCNNFCSYCVVPYVRGRERSRQKENILKEIKALIEDGCKEITLLGQNVNSYGKDLGMTEGFSTLLREINAIDGDFIIRFMTSHPKDASDELIECVSTLDKCESHFHLPLQSGSDRILKLMNRRYTSEDFILLAKKLRCKSPMISLTSDIIVGFPGETEEDFEKTLDVMRKVSFDNVFSFIYSPRNNTPAAKMPDQIPDEIKKSRMKRLLDLQQELCIRNNTPYLNNVYKCLCEGKSKSDPDLFSARTSSGKLVHFKNNSENDPTGCFIDLKITKIMPIMLFGEPI